MTALKPSLPRYFSHLSAFLETFTESPAEITDVVDIQADGTVVPRPIVSEIDLESLTSLERLLKAPLGLFKNIRRDQIMHLLKHADHHTYSDAAEMAKKVADALESIDDQVANNAVLSDEERKAFADLGAGFRRKLSDLSGIMDVEIIHDKLGEICQVVKSNPLRPANPPHIVAISRDKRLMEDVGFNLFFPATAGDLGAMNAQHGWCVASSSTYIDGVTNNGNVLVCFVPKDKEATVENCLALAHYRRRDAAGGKSEFVMDQLRWSTAIRGNQAEASNDFPHAKVNKLIVEYYEKAKAKAAAKGGGGAKAA
jgi:hypothetical protein